MWEPPQNPNGKIVHYIVTGEQHKDSNDEEVSNDRNYCNDRKFNENLRLKAK